MEDFGTVTLTLDDDKTLECQIITIYTAGEHDYIAMCPLDDKGEMTDEVFIYRYTEVDDIPDIENIEDDEELEIAIDAFDEWVDTQEFEEMD